MQQGVLRCTERTMASGDTLYLPKGIVHVAHTATDAPAAHLTVSVPMKGRLWADLLTSLVDADSIGCAERTAFSNASRTRTLVDWSAPLYIQGLKLLDQSCTTSRN